MNPSLRDDAVEIAHRDCPTCATGLRHVVTGLPVALTTTGPIHARPDVSNNVVDLSNPIDLSDRSDPDHPVAHRLSPRRKRLHRLLTWPNDQGT